MYRRASTNDRRAAVTICIVLLSRCIKTLNVNTRADRCILLLLTHQQPVNVQRDYHQTNRRYFCRRVYNSRCSPFERSTVTARTQQTTAFSRPRRPPATIADTLIPCLFVRGIRTTQRNVQTLIQVRQNNGPVERQKIRG